MERWEKIPFDTGINIYLISDHGRIKRASRASVAKYCPNTKEKIMMPKLTKKGYHRISFKVSGKTKNFYIHRLVGLVFIPPVNGKPHINHKDCVKTNNHYLNLEWCTPEENNDHAVKMGVAKRGRNPRSYYKKTGRKEGYKPVRHIVTGEVFISAAEVVRKEKYKSLNYFWKQLRGERPNPTPYRYVSTEPSGISG